MGRKPLQDTSKARRKTDFSSASTRTEPSRGETRVGQVFCRYLTVPPQTRLDVSANQSAGGHLVSLSCPARLIRTAARWEREQQVSPCLESPLCCVFLLCVVVVCGSLDLLLPCKAAATRLPNTFPSFSLCVSPWWITTLSTADWFSHSRLTNWDFGSRSPLIFAVCLFWFFFYFGVVSL